MRVLAKVYATLSDVWASNVSTSNKHLFVDCSGWLLAISALYLEYKYKNKSSLLLLCSFCSIQLAQAVLC